MNHFELFTQYHRYIYRVSSFVAKFRDTYLYAFALYKNPIEKLYDEVNIPPNRYSDFPHSYTDHVARPFHRIFFFRRIAIIRVCRQGTQTYFPTTRYLVMIRST